MSVLLRAGVLSVAVTAAGRVTPVFASGVRVLDAIYSAVRDPEWNTVPAVVTDLRGDSAEVTFTAWHEVGVRWQGRIAAVGDSLTISMDATVERAFRANRVGFCLLHPIECAGSPVTVRTSTGVIQGAFPDRIAPHQPFTNITGISYAIGGAAIELDLNGTLFEMEDHRNWTDAGFKTYCTPLRWPAPVSHQPGDRIQQSVTIRPAFVASDIATQPPDLKPAAGPARAGMARAGSAGAGPARAGAARPGSRRSSGVPIESIRVSQLRDGRLPEIGFGALGPPPDLTTAALLRAASPTHLYVELDLSQNWQRTLSDAAAEATQLGTRLDAGIVVPARTDPRPALEALHHAQVNRVFGFDADTNTTTAALADAIRAAGIPTVGGGSRANFAEFNRADLPVNQLDLLQYAITPQVHHHDDRCVLDTLLAQPHTVRDAATLGRPLVVGPITLGPPNQPAPDARQRLPFAAAWTLGTIAALRQADALTFFTTWGPGGLVDDSVHPVHAVFAALAGRSGTDLLAVDADPHHWAVLALADGPTLVGNLSDCSVSANVNGSTYRLHAYEVRVLPG